VGDVFDWRQHGRSRGLTTMDAWLAVRNAWPTNSMWNFPYSPQKLDDLAANPDYHDRLRQAIDNAPVQEHADA
jgi:hypothetical protein